MITKSELQAVLDEMRTAERTARVEPPTVDEMLAYRAGELSGDDEERVRELLTCWPELLRALMTPYPDDASLPADKLEEQWSAMRRHIGGGGRVLRFRDALTAIAAALAIVFGALLWQAKREPQRPRAWTPITLTSDAIRGNSRGVTTLPPDDDGYLLAPSLPEDALNFDAYRFELLDDANRGVWKSRVIKRTDDGVAVFVPRELLKEAKYTLVLYGVNAPRDEQLERYTLRVPHR